MYLPILIGIIFLFFTVFGPMDRQFFIGKICCFILCIIAFYVVISFITQSAKIAGNNLEYKNMFYSVYINNIQYISYQRNLIYGTLNFVGTESKSSSSLVILINKLRKNSLAVPFVINYKEIVQQFNAKSET